MKILTYFPLDKIRTFLTNFSTKRPITFIFISFFLFIFLLFFSISVIYYLCYFIFDFILTSLNYIFSFIIKLIKNITIKIREKKRSIKLINYDLNLTKLKTLFEFIINHQLTKKILLLLTTLHLYIISFLNEELNIELEYCNYITFSIYFIMSSIVLVFTKQKIIYLYKRFKKRIKLYIYKLNIKIKKCINKIYKK